MAKPFRLWHEVEALYPFRLVDLEEGICPPIPFSASKSGQRFWPGYRYRVQSFFVPGQSKCSFEGDLEIFSDAVYYMRKVHYYLQVPIFRARECNACARCVYGHTKIQRCDSFGHQPNDEVEGRGIASTQEASLKFTQ